MNWLAAVYLVPWWWTLTYLAVIGVVIVGAAIAIIRAVLWKPRR